MAATSRSASPTSGSSEHRYKQAAATVQPPEPGDSPQPQPSAGEESRQAAGHQRPGQTPHAGLPLSRAQGPQERRRQSRPCSGKSTRVSFTGACAYRSRGSARGWAGRGTLHRTTTGRPARTGSACGGHRAWSAPRPAGARGASPPPFPLPSGRPLPPRGLPAHLGAELSPSRGCPLPAKPSPAASAARPRGPPGAPAPRALPLHLLPAEVPHRPPACGAERRDREAPPCRAVPCRPVPPAQPTRRGAAAAVKGAASGSGVTGRRAGPAAPLMRLLAGGREGDGRGPSRGAAAGLPKPARPPTGPAQPQPRAAAARSRSTRCPRPARPAALRRRLSLPPCPRPPGVTSGLQPAAERPGAGRRHGPRSLRQHRPHKQLLQEAGPDLTAKSPWGLPSRVSAVAKLPQGLSGPR